MPSKNQKSEPGMLKGKRKQGTSKQGERGKTGLGKKKKKKSKTKEKNEDNDDNTPAPDIDMIKEVRAVDFCEITNSIMAYCVWVGWPHQKDHTWEPFENLDDDSCKCT